MEEGSARSFGSGGPSRWIVWKSALPYRRTCRPRFRCGRPPTSLEVSSHRLNGPTASDRSSRRPKPSCYSAGSTQRYGRWCWPNRGVPTQEPAQSCQGEGMCPWSSSTLATGVKGWGRLYSPDCMRASSSSAGSARRCGPASPTTARNGSISVPATDRQDVRLTSPLANASSSSIGRPFPASTELNAYRKRDDHRSDGPAGVHRPSSLDLAAAGSLVAWMINSPAGCADAAGALCVVLVGMSPANGFSAMAKATMVRTTRRITPTTMMYVILTRSCIGCVLCRLRL